MNSRAGRTDLPDFESGPFSRLGTSPYYKILKIADDLTGLYVRFCRLFHIRNGIRSEKLFCFLKCRKPHSFAEFYELLFRFLIGFSSQPRYDHFDTSPYIQNSSFEFSHDLIFIKD